MFIVKRSLLIAISVICAVGAVIGISAGIAAASTQSDGKVIVIDAGHGGVDAGVRGVETSKKESDINFEIATYLRGYFTDAGFKVVMTRRTQGGLYGLATTGFKMRDMKKRKQIIEESNADMVISVHQNFCPIPSRRGGQVFYDKGSECGKLLAESIQSSINCMEQAVRQSSALTGDYYMLKCTESPSVIVECGFLSNAEDEALLIDKSYQKSFAFAIFKGAIAYYS
ncbi:MAG: N-acetylmuramoyl-L-alanine amidase [Clostridia bacterium]|nr:N-acetylmuramoyl-L-alanine amidase [Clostridia bacterium]